MHVVAVTTVDLARIQFATTSLYHFLFVPLTLGLAPLVAVMQTLWYRSGDDAWLRLTRFFGTLLLINFAIGVATGLVQEFQFGMNWSRYSEYVGDVFGAPLAIEGLAGAFAMTALGAIAMVATLFTGLYPRVMVSSPDFGNSLTVDGASSSHYALKVMTVAALILAPIVLVFQGWTYYVFRARLGGEELATPTETVTSEIGGSPA